MLIQLYLRGMAKVQVSNILLLDNPTVFSKSFKFEVTFDCAENLPDGTVMVNATVDPFFNYTIIQLSSFLRFGMENNLCWFCLQRGL